MELRAWEHQRVDQKEPQFATLVEFLESVVDELKNCDIESSSFKLDNSFINTSQSGGRAYVHVDHLSIQLSKKAAVPLSKEA